MSLDSKRYARLFASSMLAFSSLHWSIEVKNGEGEKGRVKARRGQGIKGGRVGGRVCGRLDGVEKEKMGSKEGRGKRRDMRADD